ncbi:MAG: hypothetical protein WA705_28945 [Candidatus Ozemobacteraceae bacterium]
MALLTLNPEMKISMRPILKYKRGMTIVELTLYALVAGLVLAFFIFFFWRTRRMHEQQALEVAFQGSFIKLCDQLEKDLTGCKEVPQVVGTPTSLIIKRVGVKDPMTITYDVRLEIGEIVRNMEGRLFAFPFRGEREGILKTIEFTKTPNRSKPLNLKIGLNTVPPIEFSHDFPIRVSDSSHRETGYFDVPDLGKR